MNDRTENAVPAFADGLTPIHEPIHCPATQDYVEDGNELDGIDVEHFLDTLANIALAIAARQNQKDQDEND